ncbi:MAG: hypothetical protein LBP59_16245 [Planctomycetaceae bacterium]|nr:hypothetical protein [Planctomycetaceae bacterium]
MKFVDSKPVVRITRQAALNANSNKNSLNYHLNNHNSTLTKFIFYALGNRYFSG